MGDFNAGLDNAVLKDFCNLYNLTNLINKATCYKNPNNPSCIDLLLTNFPKYFQNSSVIETGLSDFHKMAVTVIKTNFRKLEPKLTDYQNYRSFSKDRFREKFMLQFNYYPLTWMSHSRPKNNKINRLHERCLE